MKADPRLARSLASAAAAPCSPRAATALDRSPHDPHDIVSLQRGARIFVNYCLGCHGAQYMRYERLEDLGLTEAQIKRQPDVHRRQGRRHDEDRHRPARRRRLVRRRAARPVGDRALARRRLALHLPAHASTATRRRPTGWNNAVFPNVAMPHVLWSCRASRSSRSTTREEDGHETVEHKWLELHARARMTRGRVRRHRARPGELPGLRRASRRRPSASAIGIVVLFFLGCCSSSPSC